MLGRQATELQDRRKAKGGDGKNPVRERAPVAADVFSR
jgi:hypothetical protein